MGWAVQSPGCRCPHRSPTALWMPGQQEPHVNPISMGSMAGLRSGLAVHLTQQCRRDRLTVPCHSLGKFSLSLFPSTTCFPSCSESGKRCSRCVSVEPWACCYPILPYASLTACTVAVKLQPPCPPDYVPCASGLGGGRQLSGMCCPCQCPTSSPAHTPPLFPFPLQWTRACLRTPAPARHPLHGHSTSQPVQVPRHIPLAPLAASISATWAKPWGPR